MTFEIEWKKYLDQAATYIKKDKELRIWVVVALVLGIGGGSYYGYRLINQRWSQKAQVAFAESYDVFNQAVAAQFNDKAAADAKREMWEQAEIDFKRAYENNAHASLAPFLKAFRGQTLLFEGDREEAVTVMTEAVAKMGSSNPYKGLYEIGLAFVMLDGDEASIEKGIKQLEDVASNEKNTFQDMALYYLGLYFNVLGEPDKAVGYWKQIKQDAMASTSKRGESPWAKLVKIKLSETGQKED